MQGLGFQASPGSQVGTVLVPFTPTARSIPSLAAKASLEGSAVASRSNVVESLALRTQAPPGIGHQRSSACGENRFPTYFLQLAAQRLNRPIFCLLIARNRK